VVGAAVTASKHARRGDNKKVGFYDESVNRFVDGRFSIDFAASL